MLSCVCVRRRVSVSERGGVCCDIAIRCFVLCKGVVECDVMPRDTLGFGGGMLGDLDFVAPCTLQHRSVLSVFYHDSCVDMTVSKSSREHIHKILNNISHGNMHERD